MSKAYTLATLATSDLATQTDLSAYATSASLTNAIDGIVIPEGGKIGQVLQTEVTAQSYSNSSTTPQAVTDLSVSIT